MPGLTNTLSSQRSIESGAIVDSRDLFDREKFEERIDYELAVLIERHKRKKTITNKEVKIVVEKFIQDVDRILKELEDAKRREADDEYRRIRKIRSLLAEGSKINSKKLRIGLEKLGKKIKSESVSALNSYRKKERKLRKGRYPIGFILKKLRKTKGLDRTIAKKAGQELKDSLVEEKLEAEIDRLISKLNTRGGVSESLETDIRMLIINYERDLSDFLDIEIDIEIEEARKLHRIDHYIKFLKMVGGFDNLIKRLLNLKQRTKIWV